LPVIPGACANPESGTAKSSTESQCSKTALKFRAVMFHHAACGRWSIHTKVRAFACEKPVHKAVAESAALSLLATKTIILPREST
jgi:hypothetical protein